MKRLLALVIVIAVGTLSLPFLMVQGQEQTQTGGIRRVSNPIPGQYIVVFKDAAASPDEKPDRNQDQNIDQSQDRKVEALVADLSQRHGAGVKHVYTSALKGFSTWMNEADALALSRDPRVAYVEEDGEVLGAACASTTQPSAPWNLDRIDQADQPLNTAYTYTAAGAGVNVYVIDSGLRTTHAEFGARASNVFDRDGGTGDDCNGHGTHVAGIIGGSTFGVAKNVKLYGLRVLGCDNRGSNSDVIKAVDWVTQNHQKPAVANMSLYSGANSAVDEAVNRSIAAGVTYVVIAGNGTNNDGVAVEASNFSPARVERAITVGATDILDNRATFSNYGSVVDVFAPGVAVTSAWNSGDGGLNTMGGTSMAAPHIAGVAAMILEVNPGASPSQIESLIRESATKDKVVNPGPGSANRLLNSSNTLNRVSQLAITAQPDDVTVCPGHQAHFSVTATGANPRYQWYKDGRPLDNIRSPKFTIVSTTATDVGAYHVVVTDECGASVTSRTAQLSPTPAPVITGEPNDVAVCPGQPVPFSVTATGVNPRYQWYKDGRPLENIKSPKFTIVSATANDLGAYHVVVTDECGSNATSRTVRLSFKPVPVIIDQPDDVSACLGHQATFSVMATGANPRYQWYKDGRPLDIRSPKFTIVTVTANDVGAYYVVVTDECGASVTSRTVKLSLTPAPVITTQPADAAVCAGYQARFSVSASGDIARYQWYQNGVPLGGATGPNLNVVAVASNEGLYHAVAIDKCGRQVESRKARLSLGGAITITKHPVNVTACAGQPVTFAASATGGNLSFQWRKNGVNIAGAEGSSFTIPAVSAANAGAYSVAVYNGCDTTKESAAATLTVNAAILLSPTGSGIDNVGGTGIVSIRGLCSWTAASNAAWITITSPASGSGNGEIAYNVAPNPGSARTGAITIAGQTFTITQQASGGSDNAQFVAQSVPRPMTVGQRYDVTIRMRNNGGNTWTTAGGYRLVSQTPTANTFWGFSEAPLPRSVAPGEEVTFSFTVTAPTTPRNYRFEWRMTQGSAGFGSFTPGLEISVSR